MLKSRRELNSPDGRPKKASEGPKVLFTKKQLCLKLIHNSIHCGVTALAVITVVKREREGGRSTSGSGRQLVNEVGVGHRDARPLGQRGGGGGGACSGQTVQLFALPPSAFKNVLRTNFY